MASGTCSWRVGKQIWGHARAGVVLWRFRPSPPTGLSKFAAAERLLLGELAAPEGRFGEIGFNDWEIEWVGRTHVATVDLIRLDPILLNPLNKQATTTRRLVPKYNGQTSVVLRPSSSTPMRIPVCGLIA